MSVEKFTYRAEIAGALSDPDKQEILSLVRCDSSGLLKWRDEILLSTEFTS